MSSNPLSRSGGGGPNRRSSRRDAPQQQQMGGGGHRGSASSRGGRRPARSQQSGGGMMDDRLPGSGPQKQQQSMGVAPQDRQELKITGFNGGRGEFNAFLAQHLDGIRYIHLQEHGPGSLTVTVNKQDVAQFLKLQAWSNGQVRVELASKARRAQNRELTEQDCALLKQLIANRFQANTQTLDLSGIMENLKPLRTNFHNIHLVNALGDIIAENCPELKTLILDGNRIETLEGFKHLHRRATNLVNLSLCNNLLTDFDELDHLAGMRDSLLELILKDNPALYMSQAPAGGAPGAAQGAPVVLSPILYHAEMCNRFPNLQRLDRQPVQRPIQFVLPSVVNRRQLPPRKGSFFDGDAAKQAGMAFIREYFSVFDSADRSKLDRLYAREGSRFSVTVEKSASLDSGMERFAEKNRNHAPCADEDDLVLLGRLKEGYIHILHALSELPASQHFANSFIADILSLKPAAAGGSAMLSVGVSGEFLERDAPAGMPGRIFRFRRQFLLMLQGQQWLILNDQLHILGSRRPKQPLGGVGGVGIAPSPQLMPQSPGMPLPGQAAAQPLSPGMPRLTAEDNRKVEELMRATGAAYNGAVQALMRTRGDLAAAVRLVQSSPGQF